jgi:chromosome segregation ATPase
MTKLTRVLVVFITLASFGFMAFVFALVSGGPNWEALADQPEFARTVSLVPPSTPEGSWTASNRSTGAQLKSSKLLAEVVLEGQKAVLAELTSELQQLEPLVEPLKAQLAESRRIIGADAAALEARATAWAAQLAKLSEALKQTNEQLQLRTVEATQVQRDLEERRFEVYRLQNQLELLRDDLFAAEQQREALISELTILKESEERLARRQQQLQQQLGAGYEN